VQRSELAATTAAEDIFARFFATAVGPLRRIDQAICGAIGSTGCSFVLAIRPARRGSTNSRPVPGSLSKPNGPANRPDATEPSRRATRTPDRRSGGEPDASEPSRRATRTPDRHSR
jgi:hypothetical protein